MESDKCGRQHPALFERDSRGAPVQDGVLQIDDLVDERRVARNVDAVNGVGSTDDDLAARIRTIRSWNLEDAFAPDHPHQRVVRGAKTGVELQHHIIRVRHGTPEMFVDHRRPHPLCGDDGVRARAGDPLTEAYRVAADIPQRATAERWVEPNVVCATLHVSESSNERSYRPDGAAADQLRNPFGLCVVAVHESFRHDAPALSRRL